jgi:2'-5' RNA ligase
MTGPPARTRRLFFAFWPDAATRAALHHASRKAVRGSGGRPVAAVNLHVTVAFLGSVPESLIGQVRAAGQAVDVTPFELVFDAIAFWPRPQVLVALCSGPPDAAAELAAALWAGLTPLGIEPDLRPYRPHVTLARKVRTPAPDLSLRPVPWPVTALTLVESVTDPAGPRYTPI